MVKGAATHPHKASDYWDLERLQARMMKEPWKAMKEALAQEHLTREYNEELFLLLRECFRHNLLPDNLIGELLDELYLKKPLESNPLKGPHVEMLPQKEEMATPSLACTTVDTIEPQESGKELASCPESDEELIVSTTGVSNVNVAAGGSSTEGMVKGAATHPHKASFRHWGQIGTCTKYYTHTLMLITYVVLRRFIYNRTRDKRYSLLLPEALTLH
jgi:hypothetical protein